MEKVVLFQGDSITDCDRGLEAIGKTGNGYATMAVGQLGAQEPGVYTFYNRGVGGNRIVDLYARMKADIVNLKPDYMSILMGVNDVWHEFEFANGVSAEKFEKVYCMLIEELQQVLPGLKIMIMEPFFLPRQDTPERNAYFAKEVPLRAAAAKRVAEKYGLVFVPLQERLTKANVGVAWDYWLCDGVHPTQAGHYLLKEAWMEGFEQLRK